MPDQSLATRLKVMRREWLGRTKLGPLIFNRYAYAFTPRQLQLMTAAIDDTAHIDGAIVEVGCFMGATTVFLKRHLADLGLRRQYFCIDTFSGFTRDDIEVERGRDKRWAYDDFDYNSPSMFKLMLRLNGAEEDTVVIEADAATHDYHQLPPVAFALVDVDLYRPVSAALKGIWERLAPGGVIVVDDCDPDNEKWDGAAASYLEFCNELGIEPEISLGKLGVLRKPATVRS